MHSGDLFANCNMKCKDCEVGDLIKCPECGKEVILCLEDYKLVNIKHWDGEPNWCDGIG